MSQSAAGDGVYAETQTDAPADGAAPSRSAALLSLPVQVSVSVGRLKATIEELLAIGPKSVLMLDSKIDDPVELIIGERVIARGRLVHIGEDGAFGVEIIALISAEERC